MTKLRWFSNNAHSTASIQNTTCTKFYLEQKIYEIYAKFNSSMPSNAPLSQDFQLLRSIMGVSETSQEIWNVRGEIRLCPKVRHDCHRTNFHKISVTQQVFVKNIFIKCNENVTNNLITDTTSH